MEVITRTPFICSATGCIKEALFVCPYCHQEETENHSKDEEGRYCSKECYQLSWPSHRTKHKPDTTALLDEMVVMDNDKASNTIGRQRSRSTSAISCRFDEDEKEELEVDDLDMTIPTSPPIPDNLIVDSTLAENVNERSSNIIGASYHNLIPPPPPYLPNYYPWQSTYPQLQLLIDHIEEIKAEVRNQINLHYCYCLCFIPYPSLLILPPIPYLT